MLDNANFLCEIGTEEIPAGYLPPVINELKNLFNKKLSENRITFQDISVCATPRRLVTFISGMANAQTEEEIEIKGPSVKAAYDDKGQQNKALAGFLNGNGLSGKDIFTKQTDKGDYIFARKKLVSKKTEEILPGIIEFVVKNIGTPKKMRWSDKTISFPRPIAYFLIMLNDKVVPFELSGIKSSNLTRGHFVQFNKMLEIKKIGDYEAILRKNGVLLDQTKRKEIIHSELLKAAEKLNGKLIEDEELLDTVTFLVENPNIVTCQFAEQFLSIPDLVLVTEMKVHQKYFAVTGKDGKLLPNFFAVSNNPATDYIKKGNERVISARFSDAAFFFNEDRKTKLIDKVESLKSVLFHKELGTIYDKIDRMSHIAEFVSGELKLDEQILKKVKRSILLSKADLETHMVFEFASLQGKMGKIYSMLDGEDAEVANAIDDQYKPRFQEDDLPVNPVSIIVSLSEKLDNILGQFSVGNIPKGSEDPYVLKRQANAIVELLIRNKLNIAVDKILDNIAGLYKNGKLSTGKILDFISARAKTIFQENGYRYDEIESCLSIGNYDFFELHKRADSVHEFRKNASFSEMLLSFKRMNNILTIFLEKNSGYQLKFKQELLQEESEKELFKFFDNKKIEINKFIQLNNYANLFSLLIEGKLVIDNFFDNVMVMCDKIDIRDNRLALLGDILSPFKNLLDFSKISD
jgi:glycyl-tRNA synthetase beta chain